MEFAENLIRREMKKTDTPVIFIVFVLISFQIGFGQNREISLETLLQHMQNKKVMTYYPSPGYTQKQFSSYDRRSNMTDGEDWYANRDTSHFIRVEYNYGRREFVLFDAKGPGVITRIWMTFNKMQIMNGTLRFYFDGQRTPAIEGAVADIVGGTQLVDAPLSFCSPVNPHEPYQKGCNLYLPIPYAKHAKITFECPMLERREVDIYGEMREVWDPCFFYNINYQTYSKDVPVINFSSEQLQDIKPLIKEVNKSLLNEQQLTSTIRKEIEIKPGDSFTLPIRQKQKAIDRFHIKINAEDPIKVLSSSKIQLSFDGSEATNMRMDYFFGTGEVFAPHKARFTEVRSTGELISYWPMPFRENAEIRLVNHSKDSFAFQIDIALSDYEWTDDSLYFYSNWHKYEQAKTGDETGRKPWDLTFVELKGQGVYVGDSMAIQNPVHQGIGWPWWGEGDEKIYVDGEAFPSHFGTGTEDYYGYAWALPMTFSHPFIAQPIGDGNMNAGLTINLRYRSLDAIPFKESIKVDMELWHHTVTAVDYGITTYWYAKRPIKMIK